MALKNVYFDTWSEYVEFIAKCQEQIDSVVLKRQEQEEPPVLVDKITVTK